MRSLRCFEVLLNAEIDKLVEELDNDDTALTEEEEQNLAAIEAGYDAWCSIQYTSPPKNVEDVCLVICELFNKIVSTPNTDKDSAYDRLGKGVACGGNLSSITALRSSSNDGHDAITPKDSDCSNTMPPPAHLDKSMSTPATNMYGQSRLQRVSFSSSDEDAASEIEPPFPYSLPLGVPMPHADMHKTGGVWDGKRWHDSYSLEEIWELGLGKTGMPTPQETHEAQLARRATQLQARPHLTVGPA